MPSARMERLLLSLDGLSVGDAYGASGGRMGFGARWTDDTAMAACLANVLLRCGHVDMDALAAELVTCFGSNPNRGYGPNLMRVLADILAGVPWQQAAVAPTHGQRTWLDHLRRWLGLAPRNAGGSCGNGAAARVAPLGAFFSGADLPLVAKQASRSAMVTHAHPEGVAGAVAVALAASVVQGHGGLGAVGLAQLAGLVPGREVRDGLLHACELLLNGADAMQAAAQLGNGMPILAQQTVPFAMWCAAKHMDNYPLALETALSAGGDSDTICAMVGGIVAMNVGRNGIPSKWLSRREPLPPLHANEAILL